MKLEKVLLLQLKNYYKRKAKKRNSDLRTIHVSDINKDFCLRRFLLCNESGLSWRPDRHFDIGILLTFRIGEKIEEIIRECLERYLIEDNYFRVEVGRFIIQGSADIVVKTKKGKLILEVKSINRGNFECLDRPLPEHEFQLQSYLYLAQIVGKGFLKHGYVVYVAKEYMPIPIKLFKVELSEAVKSFYRGLFRDLRLYESRRVLPDRCQRSCFLREICLREGKDAEV